MRLLGEEFPTIAGVARDDARDPGRAPTDSRGRGARADAARG
jgi:hypothetical protein